MALDYRNGANYRSALNYRTTEGINVVENYTVTPDDDAPVLVHQWTHDGANLVSFQLLHRDPTDSTWTAWPTFFPAADVLVSGTTYRTTTPTPIGHQWVCRALSDTEASV